jgi:8-oxo-dGTP pyrophosphatase MutT (NUDIX family)
MSSNEESPWTVIGSRQIYANPWISVREDHVLRPDGKPGIYGVVEFPTYALGVVPVDENGDVYLIGQYRYPLNAYSWEIPEGGGDKRLPMQQSAERELVEETGITAAEWIDLGPLHLSNSVTDEEGRVYLARRLTIGQSSPDGDEVLQTKKIPVSEAYEMCIDGRITDALAIIGIIRAAEYLKREK